MIINRDALTQKEMFLKERLYKNTMPKTLSNVTKGLLATQPPTIKVKKDEEIFNEKPVMKFPVPDRPTTAETLNNNFRSQKTADVRATLQHHQTQLHQATDEKMNTFLDEMRQQFMQT